LPLANPAAKRGSRTILLVAKNRKIRWVNLRDSLGPRDSRGGDRRELSKMSAKNYQLSLQSLLLLARTMRVKRILNYIMIFRWRSSFHVDVENV